MADNGRINQLIQLSPNIHLHWAFVEISAVLSAKWRTYFYVRALYFVIYDCLIYLVLGLFNFDIIIDVLASSFCSIWIPVIKYIILSVQGSTIDVDFCAKKDNDHSLPREWS